MNEESASASLAIEDISEEGLLKVRFSESMRLMSNSSRINETVFELTLLTDNEHYAAANKLNFTWTTLTSTETGFYIEIQLNWDHPSYISQSIERDRL